MADIGSLVASIGLAHMVGDYVIQSHWMAVEKTKRWWPAIAHGVTYGLPFLLTPPGKRWKGASVLPDNLSSGHAGHAIIRPSHIYRCGCSCHASGAPGQLDLFGAAS